MLNKIVENKKKEVADRKTITSEALLYTQLQVEERVNTFYKNLSGKKTISIIAEIKRASPSAGVFPSEISTEERAALYESAGADAISYVSDNTFFGGSLEEMAQLKMKLNIPLLQKDFIIDMYQIVEAAIYKVDAVLLIARILDPRELRSFVDFAQLNSIEPVVEIYNEEDLEKALQTNTRIIGVNARNLDTLEINIKKACNLMKKIPDKILKIGFSGVTSRKEVEQYKKAGASAVLVGSTLMKTKDITKTISDLKTV